MSLSDAAMGDLKIGIRDKRLTVRSCLTLFPQFSGKMCRAFKLFFVRIELIFLLCRFSESSWVRE